MTRFNFRIFETGKPAFESQRRDLASAAEARQEALETSLAFVRERVIEGRITSTQRVVIDVHREENPFLRVALSLDLEQPCETSTGATESKTKR
jgi:hypothetical protein